MKKMVDKDWIYNNWAFLSKRRTKVLPAGNLFKITNQRDVPSEGKFYGTEEFLRRYKAFSTLSYNNTPRLLLRPFVISEMPDKSIQAVFIDPKKYIFDEDGIITGTKSTFEIPIYIFK